MISKSQISLKRCLYETQHMHTSHDQRRLCHIRLNVIMVSNIRIKHHVKCENLLTPMQQNTLS